MTTVRDTSERETVEKPVLADQLEALLNASTDGLALIDMNGEIIRVNPALIAITGYSREELLGRQFESLSMFDRRAAASVLQRFIIALSGQQIPPFRVRVASRENGGLELEIQISAWRKLKEVVGAIAVVKDVTDSKRTGTPHDSEERFRDLVETTSDWVWETNEKGVYTYVSPRVTDILGYQPHEVLAKTMFDFMPLQDTHRAVEIMTGVISSRKPFRFMHTKNLRKDGHPVFLETSGNPYFGPDGNWLGYRGIHRDISDRRKAEKEVHDTCSKLESTVESVIQAITLTVEMRDCYTSGHQRKVKQLACAIAGELQLPTEKHQVIRVAALLHDLGKMFVPVEILSKPGSLTEIEFAMIKTHPQAAYDILRSIEFPWPIADVVYQHHERLDGSGYPLGLREADIVTEARVLAVSDVVEAMTFHRAYRPALGLEAALREIVRKKGSLYDSRVVEACLNVFLDRGFEWQQP